MRNLTVVTHFYRSDTKMNGDYVFVDIKEGDRSLIRYEDQYHDKGREKVEGFFDALDVFGIDYTRKNESVADADEY